MQTVEARSPSSESQTKPAGRIDMSPQQPGSCGWPRCTDRSIDGPSRTDVDETGAAHNPKVAGSNPAPAIEKPRKAGLLVASI